MMAILGNNKREFIINIQDIQMSVTNVINSSVTAS